MKPNVLTSYPYMSVSYRRKSLYQALLDLGDEINLMVDSGAFTAFKQERPIELEDYYRFLDRLLEARPNTPYFTLDVIGDYEATRLNYEAMLTAGYNPIPVYTHGSPTEYIDELYKTSDMIALGSPVGNILDKLAFYFEILPVVAGRPVHLLGFSIPRFLKFFKPTSSDSTSWTLRTRYGGVLLYDKGRFIEESKESYFGAKFDYINNLVASHGYDISKMHDRLFWRNKTGGCIRDVSALEWGVAAKELYPTTKLFYAITVKSELESIMRAKEYLDNAEKT